MSSTAGTPPEVYRYVYAVLGDSADAEDITQTTFVNALRALERGDEPRKPTNWLITIAHNLIRQRFRQQAARPREVELDRDVPATEATTDGPSVEDLVRALQRIPAPTARGARPPGDGGALLQGDQRHPRRHTGRARDEDLPRAPLARARSSRTSPLRPRRASRSPSAPTAASAARNESSSSRISRNARAAPASSC
jgi:RNA polymerase sigma-70 factor (ECF subfamily)